RLSEKATPSRLAPRLPLSAVQTVSEAKRSKGRPWTPFYFSTHDNGVVMMMMVVVTMHSRSDADVNAGAVMVMVVRMMSDHDLGGPGSAALRHTLIVGF